MKMDEKSFNSDPDYLALSGFEAVLWALCVFARPASWPFGRARKDFACNDSFGNHYEACIGLQHRRNPDAFRGLIIL